ncbi:MAG: FkbM family methyltransferase [Desulfuromonas sp.]|nr:FkbM family methyltransferase [Desulfuromonas thiophila]
MSSKPVIVLDSVGKCYQIYDKPRDRLLQMFWRQRRQLYREFWALRDLSLKVYPGEVVGVIGANGAGKSTLLQLICGTLAPSSGTLRVNGRVAALLELGAGFNPEFSGRENVYLSGAVVGMSRQEIASRYDRIVEFSGIGEFIERPVKTYSSGMYVRLAFAVAIHVDPDILIIDEALSVGDGEFARKSFDRIMAMKSAGKTILFCSHALYQVESFCDRALWLDKGVCVLQGNPSEVVARYNGTLLNQMAERLDPALVAGLSASPQAPAAVSQSPAPSANEQNTTALTGQGRILAVRVALEGQSGRKLCGRSGVSDLCVQIDFHVDPQLPDPVIGVTIDYENIVAASCAVTRSDGITVRRDKAGQGSIELCFPQLALRKGEYWVSVYLACENAVHFYDVAHQVAIFHMQDMHIEPGLVLLPHEWRITIETQQQSAIPLVELPWGARIETDEADSLGLRAHAGQFESVETDLCRRLLVSGDRVLDVGANIGYYSLLFATLVGVEGQVTAVEPDPGNLQLLRRNLARNASARAVQVCTCALSSQTGDGQLYRAENQGMHRLYPSVCCADQTVSVPLIAGDSLQLAPLDFIKIDIEGYEPFALAGLQRTLTQSPGVKVLCEFSPLSLIEAGSSPQALLQPFQQQGFRLLHWTQQRWQELSFASLRHQLECLSIEQARGFIAGLRQNAASVQQICDQSATFLSQCGYSRELFENLLFVAPAAWRQVRQRLQLTPVTVVTDSPLETRL